jgi:hypothetical protein
VLILAVLFASLLVDCSTVVERLINQVAFQKSTRGSLDCQRDQKLWNHVDIGERRKEDEKGEKRLRRENVVGIE